MKILFLTFYYPPDLSAGSFRNFSIINELSKITKNKNIEIDILTNTPIRYDNFEFNYKDLENNFKNIKIFRCKNLNIRKNKFTQILFFFKYFFFVLYSTKNKKYDIVYSSSSRLFTGFLGALLSYFKNAKYYLDLRDIFYDSFKDVFKSSALIIFKPIIFLIEYFTITRANKINLISEGFKEYFINKYPRKKYTYYTNGIDKLFLNYNFKKNINIHNNSKLKLVYAGNIGEGQAIEKIIPYLISKFQNIHFYIIGGGSRLKILKSLLSSNQFNNFSILSPVKREKLLEYYKIADILFLHLDNIPAFEKVLPSKIFEYGATHKPILAGVSGFSKKFIETELVNSYLFEPCNYVQAENLLRVLKFELIKRNDFIKKYDRSLISRKIAKDIINL